MLWLIVNIRWCYSARNNTSNLLSPLTLCVPLSLQVMCWGSSTPLQRTLSTTKALMSLLLDGVCWRPPIGWQLLSHTESQAGMLTQREWARVENNSSGAPMHHYIELHFETIQSVITSADELQVFNITLFRNSSVQNIVYRVICLHECLCNTLPDQNSQLLLH